MSVEDPTQPYIHAALDAIIRSIFPAAEPVEAHGMSGWQVELQNPPPEATWRGTFDRTHLQLFATEKKSAITVHVWHPGHPYLLREHGDALAAAGWKVMVGCLRWTRKGEPPLDPLRDLLESVRE